jgi:hypothetical protein
MSPKGLGQALVCETRTRRPGQVAGYLGLPLDRSRRQDPREFEERSVLCVSRKTSATPVVGSQGSGQWRGATGDGRAPVRR